MAVFHNRFKDFRDEIKELLVAKPVSNLRSNLPFTIWLSLITCQAFSAKLVKNEWIVERLEIFVLKRPEGNYAL